MSMPLSLAPIGQEFLVRRVGGDEKVKNHLASLGIAKDRPIRVMSQGATGTVVEVCSSRLALNTEIARTIIVG